MNTQTTTTTTTTNTPPMRKMIDESSYYELFAPGGKYYSDFVDILNTSPNDLLLCFLDFAALGVICGKREARKRNHDIES